MAQYTEEARDDTMHVPGCWYVKGLEDMYDGKLDEHGEEILVDEPCNCLDEQSGYPRYIPGIGGWVNRIGEVL